MCDNNGNNKMKSLIAKESITACHPCNNDPVGCQASHIRHVMANNLSVLSCYKNIKCQVLAYINAVSSEFVHNIDNSENEPLERARFNVLIESLIAGIHQSVKSYTNGQLDPHFQLWIQDTASTYDVGNGSIDPSLTDAYCAGPDGITAVAGANQAACEDNAGTCSVGATTTRATCEDALGTCSAGGHTTRADCEGAGETFTPTRKFTPTNIWNPKGGVGSCSDNMYETRNECEAANDLMGNANTWSAYDDGSLAKLYPNKISLFTNCNQNNGIKGDEVLYHYNPTIQLLYDSSTSSLKLRWSDAIYADTISVTKKCLFPLLSNTSNYKSEVFALVPESAIVAAGTEANPNDIWDSQVTAYEFVRTKCLLDNSDLQKFIVELDTMVRKCELTHQSLKLKLKMAAADLVIDAFDPTA